MFVVWMAPECTAEAVKRSWCEGGQAYARSLHRMHSRMRFVQMGIVGWRSDCIFFTRSCDSSNNGLPLPGRELLFPRQGHLQRFFSLLIVCHVLERMSHMWLLQKAFGKQQRWFGRWLWYFDLVRHHAVNDKTQSRIHAECRSK
ncbi:hypothetical protein M3J09_008239 [Ascochyta lentis]